MSNENPNTPSSPSWLTIARTLFYRPARACFCRWPIASKQSPTTMEKGCCWPGRFLQAAMVLLAASFSLRAFRSGGVPQRILLGVAAGFSIYVLSKLTEDLSKAELLYPLLAAWLPIIAGG